MNVTHFQAMVIFALCVSLAFAFLSKERTDERIRYAIWAFVAFLVVADRNWLADVSLLALKSAVEVRSVTRRNLQDACV